MRKHLISILTLFLFLLLSFDAAAETDKNITESEDSSILSEYYSLIPDSDMKTLKKENKLTLFLEKDQAPVYLPMISERVDISSVINESNFNTGIETLFIHKEKEYIKSIKEYFEILTDIRTLEGIQYYSHSREKYRTLFAEAYPVKGTDRNKTAEIPSYDENTKNYSFNCYIRDLSFGKNYYKLDYTVSDNYLIMKMTNIDDMRYKLIPVIGEENLTFYLIIIADSDELAIYCSGICSHVNAGFLKKKIRNSIHSRVTALYEWFTDNLSE